MKCELVVERVFVDKRADLNKQICVIAIMTQVKSLPGQLSQKV